MSLRHSLGIFLLDTLIYSSYLKALLSAPTFNYSPLVSSSKLLYIYTLSNICKFLMLKLSSNRFDVSMEKGKRMYENQFLLNVRMAVNNNTHFFNGRCKASMKKSISYIINVQMLSNGSIEACQYDCGVGEPPNAHCKHVVALLLAVEQLKRESKIILHTTCTQGLQSFHKPKFQYFGTPLRTKDLKKGKSNFSDSINFKPVDPATLNVNKYRERVRNMCVNFIANSRSTMPFKHTVMPAHTYAVALDHNYVLDPAEELLTSLNPFTTTDEISRSTVSVVRCHGRVIPQHYVVRTMPRTSYPATLFRSYDATDELSRDIISSVLCHGRVIPRHYFVRTMPRTSYPATLFRSYDAPDALSRDTILEFATLRYATWWRKSEPERVGGWLRLHRNSV